MKHRDADDTARRRADDVRRLVSMLLLLVVGLAVLVVGTLIENGWVVFVGGSVAVLGAGGLRLAAIIAVREEAFSTLKRFVRRPRS